MKTTTKKTLQPIELTVEEMKQAGGGHGVTVLAWARVDGVSPAAEQPRTRVATFLCPSDPSA